MVKYCKHILLTKFSNTADVFVKQTMFYTLLNHHLLQFLFHSPIKVKNYKYDKYLVFAHNFSRFDGMFVLKSLFKYVKDNGFAIDILKRDSDFINISIKSPESKEFEINFRDSFLLLPGSLKSLAKSFGVEDKGIFPYNFVNDPNISLDYVGNVPDFKHFSNISIEQYNEYCEIDTNRGKWDLKMQTIKYCNLDCEVLYNILLVFANEISKDLGITLQYTPTTSSMALKAFITKFLKPDVQIPIITGE